MYNKTIKSSVGHYLSGFADGEGSFNIFFRKRDDYKIGWRVSACFNVSQNERVILALFKRHLRCGTIRRRTDGIHYYEVNNLKAIIENVIPFFNRFRFLSQKKRLNFAKFKKIVILIKDENAHLSTDGIKEILSIRKKMNDGEKRRYSDNHILQDILKSSETIRRTLN